MSDLETSIEERGPVQKALKVTVDAERVSSALDAAYKKVGRSAKVDGFRKGKVPRKVLEKHYGESVKEDVVKGLIQTTCGDAIRSHELDVVSDPELLSRSFDDETGVLVFEALVETRPEFDLGEYTGLEIERRIVKVTDDHVDNMISNFRERLAVLQPEEDRVNVAHGDVLTFDMYGTVDGMPLDKATGEGIQLEVGSGRFPEDFEKGIVGVTRGIATPIEVQFPEDQGDPDLAGKLVRFNVTVREIKNKILPDLDDDFAGEVYEDCETVDQLKAKIREQLEERAGVDADQRMRGELLEKVVDKYEFDVPPSIVERQMASTLQEMGIREVPNEQVSEIREALEPGALKRVRATFVLDAIAKSAELEVEQSELEEELRRQVVSAGENADQVRNYYSNPSAVASLHGRMLRDKALDSMVESASSTDVHVDESEVAGNQ